MRINPIKKMPERPKLQEEVVELEKKLAEKKMELVGEREADTHDRELIKEIIKEKIEIPKQPKVTSPITSSTTPPVAPKNVVKKVKELKSEKKEKQIELLTDLAFDKGVVHATEVAKKLDDPYILDEFHDTLVDELYSYLIEQDKLKEV